MNGIEKLMDLLEVKEAVRDMVEKDGRKMDEERLNEFMKNLAK